MNRSILIIAEAEGFIIRGLEAKLKGIGMESSFAPFKLKELEDDSRCRDAKLLILFTDETVKDKSDLLIFIGEQCAVGNTRIIVVGTKEEFESVERHVTKSLIFKFFNRPLEMDRLLDAVEDHMLEEEKQAKRKSILVVDDDVAYMSMISDWLKDSYRISHANSGMQAITWLATNHADLILLDYEMPITSGPQVLEMIRSEESTRDIPVMFLTGKGDRESIMKVLSLKPAGYLLKTIDKSGLRDSIEKYFAR